MWISRQLCSTAQDGLAQSGRITSGGSSLSASSYGGLKNIQKINPYGYSASLPKGENVLLIPSSDGAAALGTISGDSSLEEGEIRITSKGGALIVLYNNGSVRINKMLIDSQGDITYDT